MTDRAAIRASLVAAYPHLLVDELLDAYQEMRRNFYLGGLRLSEVEGGRFCEAAYRLLEYELNGTTFTPLGYSLSTDGLATTLARQPRGSLKDSVRLHIPRALRVVYDVRNQRDAAHLADGIDPNRQDASLVLSTCSWVLAEFIRMHHTASADEAEAIVSDLVSRRTPVVQDFGGFLKVLNPKLAASDHCVVLLCQCGAEGATFAQLSEWVRPPMRANLRRTLSRLMNERDLVHSADDRYYITEAGQKYAEANRLLEPPDA